MEVFQNIISDVSRITSLPKNQMVQLRKKRHPPPYIYVPDFVFLEATCQPELAVNLLSVINTDVLRRTFSSLCLQCTCRYCVCVCVCVWGVWGVYVWVCVCVWGVCGVCVCGVRYSACKAHAPCCLLYPVWVYNFFPHYLINDTLSKTKWLLNTNCCVLIFSTTSVRNISQSKKK